MVLIPFVIITLAVGNRAVCHYVCWMSPFMIAGRKIRNLFKWPSLRLKADKEKCKDCLKCTKVCSMGLDVHEMIQKEGMENSECILCGSCIDNCPQKVIKYSFSRGK
jgi:ferredoxin-type protein NapH